MSPCSKKYFATEAESLSFEKPNREKYNLAQQFAYKCENCTGYHLSALPPDGRQLSSTLDHPALFSSAKRGRATSEDMDTRCERVRPLLAQGMNSRQIAEKLGLQPHQAYTAICKIQKKGIYAPDYKPNSVVDVDSLEAEETRLQAQLRTLQDKKQQLLDARRLKVGWYTNSGSIGAGKSVSIVKEGEHMVVTVETANELIAALEDLLTSAVPQGGVQ